MPKFSKQFMLEEVLGNTISDEVVDNSRWSINHEIVFEHEGKFYGATYSVGATESQDERPWQYDGDEIEVWELKKAKVTREEFVLIDYVEETAPVTSNGLSFLAPPPADADPIALWAFYNKAEKEAKAGKDEAAKVALHEVGKTEHKFVKTQYGGAQMIKKETKKPKDTLKFILQSEGKYDLCRKDEVDLKKVDELIEAGMLDADHINQHIAITTSSYLQLKK